MSKTILTFAVLIFFISNTCLSQAPTYKLTAKNFELGSLIHLNDALYFDVYLEHTGGGNFELAGTQLYFSFNRNIFTPGTTYPPTLNGGTSANADTSQISLKIVGSDLVTAMQPRGNSLWTGTSPQADIMRGAINTFPGAGFGTDIPVGYPGTKICRYRLWNKLGSYSQAALCLAWRNPPIVAFATKVFAYVGTTNTDITTPATHSIDTTGFSMEALAGAALINPLNNSVEIQHDITFIWNKVYTSINYNLLISDDSLFNNIVINDSAITDTFKIINSLNSNTKYYWKIKSRSNYFESVSQVWNFRILGLISLNLKIIPEGLYNRYFNLMNRRDSISVFLRNAFSPYNVIDSSKKPIDSVSFSNTFDFSNAPPGYYYIVVKHLSSLETWSKSGGESLNYGSNEFDFTVSDAQAYGYNLKHIGIKYCAYSGDVNKDGFIDGADILLIDNDSHNFVSGIQLKTDLNGDNVVDGLDFLIGDNNWQYITVKSPVNVSDSGFIYRLNKIYEP